MVDESPGLTARVTDPSVPVIPPAPTRERANVDGWSPASRPSGEGNAASSQHQVKKVGDYVLGATIGEGTFGKVRLGTHTRTSEKVAIKILEKDKIKGDEDWTRVVREISILLRIRHPHVIQLYEILQTHDQLLLIMEYASGGELFDYINAHRGLTDREACKFLQQILAGVEKLHRMGVAHRDLKAENLLLDEYRDIKVVDFGLSNTYHAGQSLKTACGSPQYAAPEMLAGHHYEPGGSDVWSCGVVLYAMICGHLPFEDRDTARLYGKILKRRLRGIHTKADLPRCVSEGAADLIRGMLTVRPEQRLQIHQIRQHPWYQHFQVMDPERPPRLSEGGHSSSCELVSRFFSWLASCERCRNWRELELIQLDDEVLDECARLWKLSRRDIMLAGHHYEPGGSDVWSCGVVLYAMICGHLPFEDRDTARLYGKILKGDYEVSTRKQTYQHFQVMDPERPPRLSEGGHSSSCELVSRFFSWLASCERCRNWRELELIQLDDEVLDECARLWKLSRRDIVSQLQQNKHNGVTTTVVLYAMICGHLPFEDRDTARLYGKILKRRLRGISTSRSWTPSGRRVCRRGDTPHPARFYLLDKRRHCYRQKLMQAAGLPGGAIPSSVAQSYGGGIHARATNNNNDPRSKAVPATGRPATHTQPPSGVDSPRTPPIRGNRSVAYGPFAADRAHRGHHQQLEQQPSLSPCCSFSPCCFPKQPAATGTFRSHAGASIPPSLMPLLPPTGYSVVPPHVATYASAPSTARGVQTRPPVMAQVTGQGGGDNVTHMYSPPLQLSGSPGSAPIPQPHHIADGREQPAGEPSAKMRALLDVDESQVVRVGGGVGVGGLPGELCGGEAASDTDEALELRPALAEETPRVVEEGEEDRPSPAPRPRTSEQPAGEPAGGPSLSAAMRDLLGSDESQVVKVAGGARVMNTARPKARGPAPLAANCAQPQPFGGRLDAGAGAGVGGGSVTVAPLSISNAATSRRPFAEAPVSARVDASRRVDPPSAAPHAARETAPVVQHTDSPAHVLRPVVQAARIAQPQQSTYYHHHHQPSPVPFAALNVNPKIATPSVVRPAVVAPAPSQPNATNGMTSTVNSPFLRPFIPQSPAAMPPTHTPTVLPPPPQQPTTATATAVYRPYLNANVHQYPPAAAYHAHGVSPRVSRITPPPAPRVTTQWYYPSPMPSPVRRSGGNKKSCGVGLWGCYWGKSRVCQPLQLRD
ncbi:unnamed protein product [Vitrella brassicaformis CCMP3155]|uniref:Protein kinase domain-containing protein n=1 Tax=Vitrella brassicaformis (strain CCMP3155) TaxID=1169540 RepID=A0A0G4H2V9_VITBC|nr:unnamed protein product [Vitrella brassicaformis CCMP3155]|eukprot:CEM38022.1 unnamed protein product [Vitrella brassicaformis CCMP3155]